MASASGDPKETEDWPVDSIHLRDVSECIGRDYRDLSWLLGFSEAEIEAIEFDENEFGVREVAYKILQKWKQREGENATKRNLDRFLNQMHRKDIVELTTSMHKHLSEPSTSYEEQLKRTIKEDQKVLCEVQTQLRELYKDIELKGLPWMEQTCLSVCDYYVELLMIQQDRHGADQPTNPIQLNKIFDTSSTLSTKNCRILVEGGPGYGKTAFGYKLCFDFAMDVEYVKGFDLVLFLPLGAYSGDLDEMLIKSSGVCTSDAARLLSILKKQSTKILIILDGIDELPKEHDSSVNSLIMGESFPHATVIVTSRPGMFATENKNRRGKLITSCDAVIPPNWFNTKIRISGIPETKLDDFVEKYLTKFSPEEKTLIYRQLKKIIQYHIPSKSFLQCPLFVLMVITLLIDSENTALQSFETKTELYKQVMNFVIRRYLTKSRTVCPELPDLFSVDFVQRNIAYVNLMIQFGQLSIETLKSSKLSIPRSKILRHNSDGRILEIGLLNKCVTVKGFMNVSCYEPIHKSLFEFAAAYSLWTEFVTGNREQWERNVCSLRPNSLSASSLVFPFLAGLMKQDAPALFQALRPYAAEYSAYFGPLILSLLEITVTPSLLSSLLPLLATRWRVPFNDWEDLFLISLQQKEILNFGLRIGKIKQITWCTDNVFSLTDGVKVSTLELVINNNLAALSKDQGTSITCTDLHCSFNGFNVVCSQIWQNILSFISSINFQRISLTFNSSSSQYFLYIFQSALKIDPLRDCSIHRIFYNLSDEVWLLNEFANLVQKERVAVLWIVLDPLSDFQKEQALLLQPRIDHLIACAAKSCVLLQFAFDNLQQIKPTIDLVQLCNKGEKSWEWIRLKNVQIHCKTDLQNSKMQIQHLCISCNDSKYIDSNLLQLCQTTLLCCCNTVLTSCLFPENLTELSVVVNESFFVEELHFTIGRLENLQILSFTLDSFDSRRYTIPKEKWLLQLISRASKLKGLEICDVGKNYSLAKEIVQDVIKCLRGRSRESPWPNTSFSKPAQDQPTASKLSYVMLSFGIKFEVENLRVLDANGCIQFISLISSMKETLRKKLLCRLDTVVWGASLLYGLPTTKQDISLSLSNLFSVNEGFRVEHDFWGMREVDSVRSKQLNRCFPALYHRFSINFVG